jgi:hypothetical protein
MSVDFVVADKKLFDTAVSNANLTSQVDAITGNTYVWGLEQGRSRGFWISRNKATINADDPRELSLLNRLKRQYSKEIVSSIALKKGWTGAWKTAGAKQEVVLKKF